jgi:DNA-binding transcriptional MerR regulator
VNASWTIRELCQQVEDSLAGEDAPENGQVRAVPDERSVRYYTTLGLLDRPSLRGRTALYGARHLAQLVAIKRYQSEGKTLAEIQQMLPAMDDHSLARFTGIALATKPARAASRRDFWREPALETLPSPDLPPPSSPSPSSPFPVPGSRSPVPSSSPSPSPSSPFPVPGSRSPVPRSSPSPLTECLELSLAPGVRLAFHTTRPATDADAAALLSAAQPLINELLRRHLIASTPATETSPEPSQETSP